MSSPRQGRLRLVLRVTAAVVIVAAAATAGYFMSDEYSSVFARTTPIIFFVTMAVPFILYLLFPHLLLPRRRRYFAVEKRIIRFSIAGIVAFMFLFMGAPLLIPRSSEFAWIRTIMLAEGGFMLFAAFLVVAYTVLHLRMFMRANRVLKQHDYLICPTCEYPLDGSDFKTRCPECGDRFHSEDVRRYWVVLPPGTIRLQPPDLAKKQR